MKAWRKAAAVGSSTTRRSEERRDGVGHNDGRECPSCFGEMVATLSTIFAPTRGLLAALQLAIRIVIATTNLDNRSVKIGEDDIGLAAKHTLRDGVDIIDTQI